MDEMAQETIARREKRQRALTGWGRLDRIVDWATPATRLRWLAVFLVLLIALGILATYVANNFAPEITQNILGILFFIMFVLALLFTVGIALEVVRVLRRGQSNSPTQRRLIALFVLMALIPTIIVAVFSGFTLNFGFESWFSDRVRNVVDSSYDAARGYSAEHDQAIRRDGQVVYQDLTILLRQDPQAQENMKTALVQSVSSVQETVARAFIISGQKELLWRGDNSYLFYYNPPSDEEMARAIRGEIVVIKDPENNEYRYLRSIDSSLNYYLYLTRTVDGEILALLDRTEETAEFYRNSEQSRQQLMILFASLYLGAAILILLAAIGAAIYFSGRITRPIGKLVRAAEQVSSGNLEVRVPETGENDEFSILSQSFNKMTADVQSNQVALQRAGAQSEAERRRFNDVLEGVSSGVIGVNRKNEVTFINSAAQKILKLSGSQLSKQKLTEIAPEFVEIVERLRADDEEIAQDQFTLYRGSSHETIFVRATPSHRARSGEVIISFDIVSELVQAQRMAAWGDVARRIAHEIKNPLTPIRLSAERIERRFGKQVTDDREKFGELTQIIVRQTQDIQRIVDEFSRFSRMPEAVFETGDWIAEIKAAIALQASQDAVEISYDGVAKAPGFIDRALFGQALTNLLKNAIESIETRTSRTQEGKGKIDLRTTLSDKGLDIIILDNGTGFPADKNRLFEPYMTMKDTGTGLGLPIVKKIIEDHDGRITLHDREDGEQGAEIHIRVPVMSKEQD